MKKRGAYQHRKEFTNRVSSIVLMIAVTAVLLALLVSFMQTVCALQEITNKKLHEYSGGYTYTLNKNRHSTSYVFSLENGENVVVKGQFLENKDVLKLSSKLKFCYSTAISISPWGGNIGVSIGTTDGSIVILSEDVSKADLEAWIYVYLLLAALILIIPLFLIFAGILENTKLIRRIFHR